MPNPTQELKTVHGLYLAICIGKENMLISIRFSDFLGS